MSRQLSLFDPQPTLSPRDPNTDPQDEQRLTGQNKLVLDALKDGPKTNQQLAFFSLKYTSRISDLRAAGYVVECERLQGGLTLYRLKGTA
jgi:hypothetical protein